jgi:CheY-like chemotaxis protein
MAIAAESLNQLRGSGARILLAEDDREMRLLVAEALRRDGWDVTEAWDGAHLLDMVFRHGYSGRVAVVISDVRMPGISGLDVLAAIRRRDAAVPVVLITAFGSGDVRTEARRLGATAVLDKPFTLDKLRNLVASCARIA